MTTTTDPQAAEHSTQPAQLSPPSTNHRFRSLLRRNWRPLFILVTIGVDITSICMAGAIAYGIRLSLDIVPTMQPETAATIVLGSCCISIVVSLMSGLYRSVYRVPFRDQCRQAAKSYVYSAFIILFGMYLLMGTALPPRFTGAFLILIPMFFFLGRWVASLANRSLQKRGYGLYNTMIVNWNGLGENSPNDFTIFQQFGYDVKAFACAAAQEQGCVMNECVLRRHFATVPQAGDGHPSRSISCCGLDDLSETITAKEIERIFVPLVLPIVYGFSDIVRVCMQHKVKMKLISRESEDLLRFSRVRDVAGISLYSPPKHKTARVKAVLKRAFDFFGSLLLILFFSPAFFFITFAILLEDGAPVFFRQRRAPMKGGRAFNLLKFRSMVKDAEARQNEFSEFNETEGGLFLMQKDPRVTHVGRWIRMFSMDELPQFFNVLRGEMSLVGPRPLMMSDLESISPENEYAGYYYLRDRTRPGITGLWQICGRREVPFRDMVLLDLYYIENQSIAFDLEILFATIPVVLFGRGAY